MINKAGWWRLRRYSEEWLVDLSQLYIFHIICQMATKLILLGDNLIGNMIYGMTWLLLKAEITVQTVHNSWTTKRRNIPSDQCMFGTFSLFLLPWLLCIILLLVNGASEQQPTLSVEVMRSVNYSCLLQENVVQNKCSRRFVWPDITCIKPFLFPLWSPGREMPKGHLKEMKSGFCLITKGLPIKTSQTIAPAEDTCLSLWHGQESAVRDK